MPQLQVASRDEDNELNDHVPHSARIGCFAQISKLGLALALVLLLAANVAQLVGQVAQLVGDLTRMLAVLILVVPRRTHDDVKVEPDMRGGEPGGGLVC